MVATGRVDEPLLYAVARQLLRGKLTLLLGAGVNLCDRPADLERWTLGCGFYPSGAELAQHLAERIHFDGVDDRDLMEVATQLEFSADRGLLYEWLREVFDVDGAPTSVHRFIAETEARRLAGQIEKRERAPLIVTTNYDDALERAMKDAGAPFEVVAYIADGAARGRFRHMTPDADAIVIDRPDVDRGRDLGTHLTILKLHGTIDRASRSGRQVGDSGTSGDSFVITEPQYVDYLTTDVWDQIPWELRARLLETNMLFVGYGLHDWNLLVVLNRIDALPHPRMKQWAIQLKPTRTDIGRWKHYQVECFDIDVSEFVREMRLAVNFEQ
jgi:hypothetical protein